MVLAGHEGVEEGCSPYLMDIKLVVSEMAFDDFMWQLF